MNIRIGQVVKEEKGAALALTIIVLLIGGLVIAPVLAYMGTGIKAGEVHEIRMEQLYAADAGVEDAVWKIENSASVADWPDPECGDPPWDEPYEYAIVIAGEPVEVSILYLGDDYYRVSSATAGSDSSTSVESCVFYGNHWKNILDYGIVALGSKDEHGEHIPGHITITGTSKLDSYPESHQTSIYAHGNINIGNNAQVLGDATATGTIDRPNNVSGIATQGYDPPVQFTLPDLSVYEAKADQGQLIQGTLDVEESRSLGPARITGDLNLAAQAVLTLTGVVWVEGKIVTAGGSEIKGKGPLVAVGSVYLGGAAAPATEQMPVIISTHGPIDAAGTQESFMVLYAPNGMITIQGNAKTNGAAVGKEVTISISAQVRAVYDLEVVNRVREPHIRVLTWEVDTQ